MFLINFAKLSNRNLMQHIGRESGRSLNDFVKELNWISGLYRLDPSKTQAAISFVALLFMFHWSPQHLIVLGKPAPNSGNKGEEQLNEEILNSFLCHC